jgi:hypothetical protein
MTDDSDAATEVVRNEIDSLREGERDYDYRHRQSFMVVSRLRHVLDAIELALLPRKPALAVEMLTRLIERDVEISAHCLEDGFGAEQAFSRACDLFRLAAQSLPTSVVQPIIDRLRSLNDFGLRSRLGVDT